MSIGEIKRNAKYSLKGNVGFSIVVMLIVGVISALSSLITGYIPYVGWIISLVVTALCSIWNTNYYLSLVNSTCEKTVGSIFKKSNRVLDGTIAQFLMFLIFLGIMLVPMIIILINVAKEIINIGNNVTQEQVASLLIGQWIWILIMFVLIFLVSTKLVFVPYLICSNKKFSGLDCIKESWYLSKGNFGRIILFELSFFGWGLLTAITFGIAGFYVIPYMNTALAHFYKVVCEEKGLDYETYSI